MNTPAPMQTTISAAMQSCFEHQRAAYLAAPEPNYAQRVEDLNKLAQMLKEHREAVIEAINQDYGNRSTFETLFAEFFVVLDDIKSNIKHLKKWMKPQKRKIDLMVYPTSSNRVIPPAIFPAGNRAMLKMSENSNHLARLLIAITPKYLVAYWQLRMVQQPTASEIRATAGHSFRPAP